MRNDEKKPAGEFSERLGKVGGQAVLEGVMMKSGKSLAIAVRKANGETVLKKKNIAPLKDKYKILGIPIIRGFINFIEMMALSMSTLNESAEMAEMFEESSDKGKAKDAEDKKSSGATMTTIASVVGIVLGIGLSILLFFYLPVFIGKTVSNYIEVGYFLSLLEGVLRLAIFLVYILLVSLIKDIRRTFEYHGAEHMSVFCYESGSDLTVENAMKFSRFHPRCGTSFMIVMMIVGVVISILIPNSLGVMPRMLIKLAIFPVIIGIGYEFIRFAGKHDNLFVRIISAPGLWMQRLTTKKPDEAQLEIALAALKAAVEQADEEAASAEPQPSGNAG